MEYKPPYTPFPLLPLVISHKSDCNQSLSKTKMSLPYQTFLCSTFCSNFIIFTHKLKLNHILNVKKANKAYMCNTAGQYKIQSTAAVLLWGKPASNGTCHHSCSAQGSAIRSTLSYYSLIITPKIKVYQGITLYTMLLH